MILPDLWTAVLDTGSGTGSTVNNLAPAMYDHPTTGDEHIENISLKITTDPQAPADTFQPLTIRAEHSETQRFTFGQDINDKS